jgi:hypothetical protein
MFQEQYIFFIIFNIFFYFWNIISKFPEFNTREYSSTRKTPRHYEEMYDPRLYDYHYSVDYLLKDKINTKLRMIRLDDQIDTIFFSEILWRFEERILWNPLTIWRKTNTKLCFSTKHLTNIRLQCNRMKI